MPDDVATLNTIGHIGFIAKHRFQVLPPPLTNDVPSCMRFRCGSDKGPLAWNGLDVVCHSVSFSHSCPFSIPLRLKRYDILKHRAWSGNQSFEVDHGPSKSTDSLINAAWKARANRLPRLPHRQKLKLTNTANPSSSTSPPSELSLPGKTFDISCVKSLLKKDPDSVYRFQPNDHDAHAPERKSFNQLIEAWACTSKEQRKNNRGSFPEVRKEDGNGGFWNCVVRCCCVKCLGSESEAVELRCRPYAFGKTAGSEDVVLAHQFKRNGELWAVVLGSWDDPAEYRLWGAIGDGTDDMGYNESIRLREVDFARTTFLPEMLGKRKKRSGRHSDESTFGEDAALPHRKRAKNAAVHKKRTVGSQMKENEKPSVKTSAHKAGKKCKQQPGNDTANGAVTDDEDNIRLSELGATRRKAAKYQLQNSNESAKLEISSTMPQPPTCSAFDMSTAYETAAKHLATRTDSSGRPVLVSNAMVRQQLSSLENARGIAHSFLFRTIWNVINGELTKAGVARLLPL